MLISLVRVARRVAVSWLVTYANVLNASQKQRGQSEKSDNVDGESLKGI